ncbi:MAG: HRDC domain-containing protein [Caldilineaceae bacterium]
MSKQPARSRQQRNAKPDIPAPILVQSAREFSEMMSRVRTQSLVAVDTESDSLYRYTPRVCLIQVSACNDTQNGAHNGAKHSDVVDYLVDPLKLNDLGALGDVLADPAVEVILHAAENDILLLNRDFGFETTNVFDTQLAARILGRNGVGLAAMLEEEFGVISDKRMQRTDWGRRPLTPQQMTYAQLDTHYLPALRRRQIERLTAQDRLREAQEAFDFLSQIRYSEPAEPRNLWSMKGTREVEREQTGLLEELWLWREQTAQRRERPPFKVVNDRVLIELALNPPSSLRIGRDPRPEPPSGRSLRQRNPACCTPRQGSSSAGSTGFFARPEALLNRRDQKLYQSLRQWRSATAGERGVDPDIIFSNDLLLQIVEHKPATVEALVAIPAIGAWKAETYGPSILQLLK